MQFLASLLMYYLRLTLQHLTHSRYKISTVFLTLTPLKEWQLKLKQLNSYHSYQSAASILPPPDQPTPAAELRPPKATLLRLRRLLYKWSHVRLTLITFKHAGTYRQWRCLHDVARMRLCSSKHRISIGIGRKNLTTTGERVSLD